MVVYADILFVINTLINYILLLLTARTCDLYVSRIRLALGAAFGGAYAVAALYIRAPFFSGILFVAVSGIVMALIVFGKTDQLFRAALVFFAYGAALAGLLFGLQRFLNRGGNIYSVASVKTLAITFFIAYFLLSVLFRRFARNRKGGGIVPVQAELGRRKIAFNALRDTGNSLSDPLTGRRVIVTDYAVAAKLLDEQTRDWMDISRLSDPVGLFEKLVSVYGSRRVRLIPYSAVGVKSGFLLAFRPDHLTVGGVEDKKSLLAISPTRVSDGGQYSALAGV